APSTLPASVALTLGRLVFFAIFVQSAHHNGGHFISATWTLGRFVALGRLPFTSSSSRRTSRRNSFLLPGVSTSAGPSPPSSSSSRTSLLRGLAEVHAHHLVQHIPLIDGKALRERQRHDR